MSPLAETLLRESLKLSEFDRSELAAQILDSLPSDGEDDDIESSEAEIARRIQELDDGAIKAIPWNQARKIILGIEDDPQL